MTLIEKWKIGLNQKRYTGAVLMDLSKALDTINHELLTAKLHAYCFSKDTLEIKLLIKPLSRCKDHYKVYFLDGIDSSGISSFPTWANSIQYLST